MGKSLVVVESPTKARTLAKFLGPGYDVVASFGHVRDLPSKASEIPKGVKAERWARLGVNVERGYEPLYVVPADQKARIRELKARLKGADALYLATDEDREGESIAWHLLELLQPKVPVRRMVFHEITKTAIREALERCREVDKRLVDAQEARRILDRLYGYEVSPVLWRKIAPRLSAGRVQSVATRLLVDREKERMAFRAAEWWDAAVTLEAAGRRFPAQVATVQGWPPAEGGGAPGPSGGERTLAAGRDFGADGRLLPARLDRLVLGEAEAARLARDLAGRRARVDGVERKQYATSPKPPFTTSTLQQEAGRKLGMTARRAMAAAQRLYESGFITYMRTDSVKLSAQAVEAAREIVRRSYPEELPARPRLYEGRSRNAQEAHEAIRPAGERFRPPEEVAREVGGEEARLYELIWKRTVASQMENSLHQSLAAAFACELPGGGRAGLVARGRVLLKPGYLRAYVEGADEPEPNGRGRRPREEPEAELPPLEAGVEAVVVEARPDDHRTKPPARYTEAALVQKLEELGIGRPSTYASIIATILDREYAFRRSSALVPTPLAFAVVSLMDKLAAELIDYEFTAEMENRLDAIALGKLDRQGFLDDFYRGGKRPGLHAIVTERTGDIDPKEVGTIRIGEEGGDPILLRVGKYGPYLERAGKRASVPGEVALDEMTKERALELLEAASRSEEPLGSDPDGVPVYLRTGRFGPYVQLGPDTDDRKRPPRRASLFRGMDPRSLTLEQALQLLSLPRTLGALPDGGSVTARQGRFGPYLEKSLPGTGKPETRSLENEDQLLTVTLEEAAARFATPKRGRPRRDDRAPLRELGPLPGGAGSVVVREGRYGPYVTDGKTNATLPRGAAVESLTLEEAVRLLESRRSAGSRRRQGSTRASRARGKR